MPKQRPPFDYERYASLKAQGLSQRQIAHEMGMPDATLRNNLKVDLSGTSGGPPTSTQGPTSTPAPMSTEIHQGTPAASTQVHHDPPPASMQLHLRPPASMSTEVPLGPPNRSTEVPLGPPKARASRDTQVSPGGLTEEMAHDLHELVAWWRQRAGVQAKQGPLVRHTFHVAARWLEAIRREAVTTGESYATVLNRALAAYFGSR